MTPSERMLLCADLLEEWDRNRERALAGEPDLGTVPRHDQGVWLVSDKCGTTCCAWGYLATRQEIRGLGVDVDDMGTEAIIFCGGSSGYGGIAHFFGEDSWWAYGVFGVRQRPLSSVIRNLRETAARRA